MTELLTSAQMRAIEEAAIASGAVTGLELMERAGRGVVEAVLEEWPELGSGTHSAVVLCGPGNNGGDGFVVARLLAERGWQVDVRSNDWQIFLNRAALERQTGDAWVNARRWHDLGATTGPMEHLTLQPKVGAALVVVDALLGIGQTRSADALLNPYWAACDLRDSYGADGTLHLVSIDVPTGYDSDSADALATNPFEPDLIVTFHRRKPVHRKLQAEGVKVVVTDIGL